MPDVVVKHPSIEKVGIDVGLENFATLSNGEVVTNPRHLVKSEKRLKLLQRRVSRKVKGSANRRKAKFRLAKQHLKVSNQRTDFLHKLSRSLAIRYGIIAVENLNIKNMVKNHYLARSINDASWGIFFNMLSYKEVIFGGECIKRNPRRTSKTCNRCGAIMDMPLNKRIFQCLNCGFVCHRDENASLNILNGMGGLPKTYNACGDTVRPSLKARVVETGTIIGSTSS